MTPERLAAQRIAVLIDADQFGPDGLDAVMDEAMRHGTVVVLRAYRHWPKPTPKGWAKAQEKHGVEAVEQAPGPNATDMALVIDAVDLIHDRRIDGFVIVTNDRDFGPLAGRLRRGRLRAVLIAHPKQADGEYRALWDRFCPYPPVLAQADKPSPPTAAQAKDAAEDRQRIDAYRSAIAASDRDADGWARLSDVGKLVPKEHRAKRPATWLGDRREFDVDTRKFKNSVKDTVCVRSHRKPSRSTEAKKPEVSAPAGRRSNPAVSRAPSSPGKEPP